MHLKELKTFLTNKIDDMKAQNIIVVDLKGKSSITDYMIICTGTSKRHVTSIAEYVGAEVKKINLVPLGIEGTKEGEWVVLDMGNVMLHVMQQEYRDLYQLEKLWGI